MASKITAAVVGLFVVAYACDFLVSDKKIFGCTILRTVASKDWWVDTDKKFQAWPRTAASPVVMNLISRKNYILKTHAD